MHIAVPTIASCGISPIVRIADNQSWMVKRALDSGARKFPSLPSYLFGELPSSSFILIRTKDGILVPLIYTLSDVHRLVASAKFPPLGVRGFGSPFPMERFHPSITSAQYLQQANDSTLVCVQIETKEALEDLESIAAVDGVDVLFVGPFDLGNNIGRPILDGVMHEECESCHRLSLSDSS